jgi:hypothetical protein
VRYRLLWLWKEFKFRFWGACGRMTHEEYLQGVALQAYNVQCMVQDENARGYVNGWFDCMEFAHVADVRDLRILKDAAVEQGIIRRVQ